MMMPRVASAEQMNLETQNRAGMREGVGRVQNSSAGLFWARPMRNLVGASCLLGCLLWSFHVPDRSFLTVTPSYGEQA